MKKYIYFVLIAIFFIAPITQAQNKLSKNRFINSDGCISTIDDKSTDNSFEDLSNSFRQKSLTLIWEADEDVSNHQDVDSWNPRMAVDNDGTIHIVYNDNQSLAYPQKIMYSKKEVGAGWETPIIVDENTNYGSRNSHVPAIAVSPNGDVHIAYLAWAYENWRHEMAYTCFDAATQTWSPGIIISEAGGSIESYEVIDVYSTIDNRPVVIWGFDNRSGLEEVYMKYFDGTDWSSDIIVSTPSDSHPARFPRIERIDNDRAMIIFWEETATTDIYKINSRFFDESTNSLSTITPIPQTEHHTENPNFPTLNFDLTNNNNGHATIAFWEYEYPLVGQMSDTIKCVDYDITNDIFTMSSDKLIGSSPGYFPKYVSVSSNNLGETGIVFMDTYAENISFVEFDFSSGFSTPEVIVSQDIMSDNYPDTTFDNFGNYHFTWSDLRYDISGGYVEREVFYKRGRNPDLSVSEVFSENIDIFPNPTSEILTINTADIKLQSIKIYNPLGQLIYSNVLPDFKNEINISEFETGIYLCVLKSENEVYNKRIIVE